MNIMPPLSLNSLNTDQAVNARTLEAFVGTPPRRLLIFTGIAMPALRSNGQLDGQEVTIDLNERSNTRDPKYAATVGLASIYNSDSDLLFATDDVKVITGSNLELLLVCNIAVLGDYSVLNRFAYQATVFLEADTATIAGSIRWNPHFLMVAGPEQDLFQINAITLQPQPPAVPGQFGTMINKVVGVGATVGSVVRQGAMNSIDYVIPNLPLGVAITVIVDPKPGAFVIVNTQSPFIFFQVSGPEPTTLSSVHLMEKPVDFEARPFSGPR